MFFLCQCLVTLATSVLIFPSPKALSGPLLSVTGIGVAYQGCVPFNWLHGLENSNILAVLLPQI